MGWDRFSFNFTLLTFNKKGAFRAPFRMGLATTYFPTS